MDYHLSICLSNIWNYLVAHSPCGTISSQESFSSYVSSKGYAIQSVNGFSFIGSGKDSGGSAVAEVAIDGATYLIAWGYGVDAGGSSTGWTITNESNRKYFSSDILPDASSADIVNLK